MTGLPSCSAWSKSTKPIIGGKETAIATEQEAAADAGTAGKIPVIGAISRKGNVVCQMIENTDTETLTRFVRKYR